MGDFPPLLVEDSNKEEQRNAESVSEWRQPHQYLCRSTEMNFYRIVYFCIKLIQQMAKERLRPAIMDIAALEIAPLDGCCIIRVRFTGGVRGPPKVMLWSYYDGEDIPFPASDQKNLEDACKSGNRITVQTSMGPVRLCVSESSFGGIDEMWLRRSDGSITSMSRQMVPRDKPALWWDTEEWFSLVKQLLRSFDDTANRPWTAAGLLDGLPYQPNPVENQFMLRLGEVALNHLAKALGHDMIRISLTQTMQLDKCDERHAVRHKLQECINEAEALGYPPLDLGIGLIEIQCNLNPTPERGVVPEYNPLFQFR